MPNLVTYAQYYYSDNKQIPLKIDSTKALVLLNDEWQFDYESMADEYVRIDSIDFESIHDNFKVAYFTDQPNYEQFLDSLRLDYRVASVNPYYLNSLDSSQLVGNTILCKFYSSTPYSFIDSLNAYYGIDLAVENEITPKRYVLRVGDDSPFQTLEIANIYYELPEVEYSHPNFLGGFEWNSNYIIYDHYWDEQWGMHRAHRVLPGIPDSLNHKAYQITVGDTDIVVAVLDQGVSPHEDLPAIRFVDGYDFAAMDDDPGICNVVNYGWHGMGVAGIIGASHNPSPELLGDRNTGIYGMAPLCKIMPIKIGNGFPVPYSLMPIDFQDAHPSCKGNPFASDSAIAAAFAWAWANGADIISCSWGGPNPKDDIEETIEQAAAFGRDGKGCAIFFSAGNDSTVYTEYYPAMYDEVISVGSLHPDDSVWGYSGRAKVDVVAPSGRSNEHPIWTIDSMDSLGYNNQYHNLQCGEPNDMDYNCKFGGTSAAQPMVAGIAALILSVKPELTRQELYGIIENSAERDLYVNITNPPYQEYGYGMASPYRALLAISRGDVNNDGDINILDIMYLQEFKFSGGAEPIPEESMGDVNCDGIVNVLDIIYLISYKFKDGPAPQTCFNYDLLD